MKPLISIKPGTKVVIKCKAHTNLSQVADKDVGKMFTVKSVDMDGRKHNRYVSGIVLENKKGRKIRASIDELSLCNPNYEPEGEFLVCVGCGATIAESALNKMRNIGVMACPKCKMLEPTES